MKAPKGCAVTLVTAIVIAAAATIGIGNTNSIGFWFIQGTFDRVNPLAVQVVAYASAPAPDAYFESYGDATGSGENYVYEVHAYDESGIEHKVNLISFGNKLDGETGGCLKLAIKGSYVQSWELIAADAVPAAAARALE